VSSFGRFGACAARVSMVAVVVLAAGCGNSKVQPSSTSSGLVHFVSQPMRFTQGGDPMKYRAVTSKPGASAWQMEAGPAGATIDAGGTMTWKPSPEQSGSYDFTISAEVDGQRVRQHFSVTATKSVMAANATVDPQDPNGATISVDAPLSPMRGTTVQVDPGALPSGPPLSMTISSMEHAPVPPMSASAGVPPGDLRPMEFGPGGTAFKKPVKLQLPIPAGLRAKGIPVVVQTFDYATGNWHQVKLLSVDMVNGFAIAEAPHFSTYVVAPEVKAFDLKLGLGATGSACQDALLVQAPLALALDQVPAAAINGWEGKEATATVATVLNGMSVGQALQVLIRVSARAQAATGNQSGWVLGAAIRQADGRFKVSVNSDGHTGPFLSTPSSTLAATDPELLAWLNGTRVDFVFGGLGHLEAGAVANAEVSLYLVPAADASRPPPSSANALATAEISGPALAATEGYDNDCDGAPNAWDPEPSGMAPPMLVGFPDGPVHLVVGSPTILKVGVAPTSAIDASFAWTTSDPSVVMTASADGLTATVTPGLTGAFQVWATGTANGTSAVRAWDVLVDPASVAAANTPPLVAVTASAHVVRVGESVRLAALGKDAEQPELTYSWAAADPMALSTVTGPTVVFTASGLGDHEITCIASDGLVSSAPAKMTITVISELANRPPGVPSVSPMGAALQHDPGQPVSLTMKAVASDPDGDALAFDFVADPTTPSTFTLTKDGATAAFTTKDDGLYLFYVTATDEHGARGPWSPVKIQVLSKLPTVPIDADKDGYPAGFDCNDNDPRVFPGAKEMCGDGVDQNCDGKDLPMDACDLDGDRFSVIQGDCDDRNPAISPAALERCDGIDNNCNRVVDEGFETGKACAMGQGACQAPGKTVCSANFTGAVCGAALLVPTPETCDGVDNDCNGRVDDVLGQTLGDNANCGGCGIACVARANTIAACVGGGCTSICAAGFVDADGDTVNGCECGTTNGGIEVCDGLDNDCNGAVDDGVTATYYDAPAATQGVGVCHGGVRICKAGMLVIAQAQQIPMTEACDGVDNDCNGKVDETFDLLADPRNCGACGVVCALGVACSQGRCAMSGGGSGGTGGTSPGGSGGAVGMPGLASCAGPAGSVCTDLMIDPANCGACGRACAATESCLSGACSPIKLDCPAPKAVCSDAATGKVYCTDPNYDPNNCGGCGRTCGAGVACQMGACQGTMTNMCPAGADNCPLAAGGVVCTSFMNDPMNCGGCGRACPASTYCQMGTCVPMGGTGGTGGTMTCAAGYGPCPAATGGMWCAFLDGDAANCGACGKICAAGSACQAGVCVGTGAGGAGGGTGITCPNGQGTCQSATGTMWCADFMSDPANCGGCGRACPAATVCRAGVCDSGTGGTGGTPPGTGGSGSMCAAGFGTCSTATGSTWCANLLSDPANCGVCGKVCPAGTSCQSGACAGSPMCQAPTVVCLDPPTGKMYCTDPSTDFANCGGCGRTCPAGAICTAGMCQGGGGAYAGAAPCPGTNGAPMCTNLLNDPANCGACGKVCGAGLGCYSGVCNATPPATTCPPDAQLCADPMVPSKMYCAVVLRDPSNCGDCGHVCSGGLTCVEGTCMPPPTGGTTSMTCPAAQRNSCVNAAGQMYCTDLLSDPSNCGVCGKVCPSATFCQNAACVPVGTAGAGGTSG